MAKKLLTFNKAQRYLAEKGLELSTQQVRNLARTNDAVMAGVTEYIDPVTESKTKVIAADALDRYLAWRAANPEPAHRGGRQPASEKRAWVVVNADQFAAINELLSAQGLPLIAYPEKRPRKAKTTPATAESNGTTQESMDVEELELIEVD